MEMRTKTSEEFCTRCMDMEMRADFLEDWLCALSDKLGRDSNLGPTSRRRPMNPLFEKVVGDMPRPKSKAPVVVAAPTGDEAHELKTSSSA